MYYEWFVLYRLFCWIFFRDHSNWTNWLSHHMHQSSCANADNFTTLTRKKPSSAKRQCQGKMLQVENRSLSNKNYETPKHHSNNHPCNSTWGMAPYGMKVKKNLKWMFQVQQYSTWPTTIEFSRVLLCTHIYIYIKGSVVSWDLYRVLSYFHLFFRDCHGASNCSAVLWQDLKADHHPTDQSGNPAASKGLETERLGISRYFWITRTKQRT